MGTDLFSEILLPPNEPKIVENEGFVTFDLEFNSMVRTNKASSAFKVNGEGTTVAVFDTGLNSLHECFEGRVIKGKNFSSQGAGDNTEDTHGHGTNVTGLIAGKGTRVSDPREGIAPGAKVMPVKVLPGNFSDITRALIWVYENRADSGVTLINLSLGMPGTNFDSDLVAINQYAEANQLSAIISKLKEERIAVVFAAGNSYGAFQKEGMAFPAIIRNCISVGAVFDAHSEVERNYSGTIASRTSPDQVTPFSQRLSRETSKECFTTVFAPGASATSAGIGSKTATSIQDGTSQAAPTVAGVALLVQQFIKRQTGQLPTIEVLKSCLRSTSVIVYDQESDDDNVKNSGKRYPRVDAYDALIAAQYHLNLAELGAY